MAAKPWIVVGTDFSDGAAHALEQGVNLAARVGASVACVHAYEDAPGTYLRDEQPTEVRERLAHAAAASGARDKGVRLELVVRRGPAWEKLLNVAFDLGALLIVVGARGLGQRGNGSFLGTVAMRLAALSTRMVLIVPKHLSEPPTFETEESDSSLARVAS